MQKIKLYDFQIEALNSVKGLKKCAFYYEMGLGKTFIGSEKLREIDNRNNLVVCQKSKISDWCEHFEKYYSFKVFDLTKGDKEINAFMSYEFRKIGIINYDLIWRKCELLNFKNYTLLCDESAYLQNYEAKRTDFIVKRLKPDAVILLSGACVSGKYEWILPQAEMLGWKISEKDFYNNFCRYRVYCPHPYVEKLFIYGYKNIDFLKLQLNRFGARFKKTEEVLTLPKKITIKKDFECDNELLRFYRTGEVNFGKGYYVPKDTEEGALSLITYERLLCAENEYKMQYLSDILSQLNDRVLIFYNYNVEFDVICKICKMLKKPISIMNGATKDLTEYEKSDNSVVLINYGSGAMGLNLQKAHYTIFYSPNPKVDVMEQAEARTSRIGQEHTCFYYHFAVSPSIETKIYESLKKREQNNLNLYRNENEIEKKETKPKARLIKKNVGLFDVDEINGLNFARFQ